MESFDLIALAAAGGFVAGFFFAIIALGTIDL